MSIWIIAIPLVTLFAVVALSITVMSSSRGEPSRLTLSILLWIITLWTFSSVMARSVAFPSTLFWLNVLVSCGMLTGAVGVHFAAQFAQLRGSVAKWTVKITYFVNLLPFGAALFGGMAEKATLLPDGLLLVQFGPLMPWIWINIGISICIALGILFSLFRTSARTADRKYAIHPILGYLVMCLGSLSNLVFSQYPLDIALNLVFASFLSYGAVSGHLLRPPRKQPWQLHLPMLASLLGLCYIAMYAVSRKWLGLAYSPSHLVAAVSIVILCGVAFDYPRRFFLVGLTRRLFPTVALYRQALAELGKIDTSLAGWERGVVDALSVVAKTLGADIALLFMRNEETGCFEAKYAIGIGQAAVRLSPALDSPIARYLSEKGAVLSTEEARQYSSHGSISNGDTKGLSDAGFAVLCGVQAHEKLVAILALGPRNHGALYEEQDKDFLRLVAGQIALSIQNDIIYSGEKRYRLLAETMSDGLAILDKNNQGTYANEAFCRMLGYSRDEILGCPLSDFLDEANLRVLEGHLAMRRRGGRERYEIALTRKDGQKVPTLVSPAPLFDGDGQYMGTFAVFTDTSERKHAEEALKESEEKYRLLVENSHDAIFIAQDGAIKFPNPKTLEMSGYSAEELAGIPFADLVHPQDREMVFWGHQQVLRGESPPIGLTCRIVNREGNEVWVYMNSVPVVWEGRSAILNSARDITSQKTMEIQLQQAQKLEAVGALAGGIAHDFNNILLAIIGNAEMAMIDVGAAHPAQHSIDQIMKAGERARELVKHILTFSRKGEKELKPLRVGLVIKEALRLLRASIPTTIEIRQDLRAKEDTVLGDPTQIHQILMNLGTNAYHAMRENGGILEVTLTNLDLGLRNSDENEEERHRVQNLRSKMPDLLPGKHIVLSVRDTGCGIDPAHIHRVFDPYFTTKDKGVGTGLGLAVVNGIVRAHGGTIAVESEPGKGAVFTVVLPLMEREVAGEVREIKAPPKGNERILFVDDEVSIVDLGKRRLQHLGYDVTVRTSSLEALEAFRAHPEKYDLVITDLAMPHIPGDRLAMEILKIRPDIPIILCTGFSERISEARAKEIGIKAYVMKPLIMGEMAETIRKVL